MSRVIFLLTDGEVNNISEVVNFVTANSGNIYVMLKNQSLHSHFHFWNWKSRF